MEVKLVVQEERTVAGTHFCKERVDGEVQEPAKDLVTDDDSRHDIAYNDTACVLARVGEMMCPSEDHPNEFEDHDKREKLSVLAHSSANKI
jgi:hypothetical protein